MNTGTTISIVMTTTDDHAEAMRLAREAVDQRLAACVQIDKIESIYHWGGKVEQAAEYRLAAKTTNGLIDALRAFWARKHSYELPEIIVVPISDGSENYIRWVQTETRQGDNR